MKMTGLEYVVDYVLQRIGDLEKVYLVGNMSRGHNTEIIDLVLVGDNINKTFLIEQIEKAEKKINKKIRYVHFKSEEFDISKISEPGLHPLLLWSK
jgi:3-dehydroquinate synthase class II